MKRNLIPEREYIYFVLDQEQRESTWVYKQIQAFEKKLNKDLQKQRSKNKYA